MNLSDEDIQRIVDAVTSRTQEILMIEHKKHYDDHKKLDALLRMYEDAVNIVWKGVLSLAVIGVIILASIGILKGGK